jgi:uncharacterized protein (TIGR03067 family)
MIMEGGGMRILEGVWSCESFISGGVALSEDVRKTLRLELAGTYYRMFREGRLIHEGFYTMDEAKDPKELLVTSPETGRTYTLIYHFDGDQLVTCSDLFGEVTPREFASNPPVSLIASEPGSVKVLHVWKRIPPASEP